jgi:hypothetical protein
VRDVVVLLEAGDVEVDVVPLAALERRGQDRRLLLDRPPHVSRAGAQEPTKRYGAVIAVDGLSFEVSPGETAEPRRAGLRALTRSPSLVAPSLHKPVEFVGEKNGTQRATTCWRGSEVSVREERLITVNFSDIRRWKPCRSSLCDDQHPDILSVVAPLSPCRKGSPHATSRWQSIPVEPRARPG